MLKMARTIGVLAVFACIMALFMSSPAMARTVVNPNNMQVPPPGNGGALKIAELVNEERAKYGLKPLKFYSFAPVQKAARIRAGEIRQKFEHLRLNNSQWYTVLDSLNINYSFAGENIGKASGMKPENVMQMWMASQEHRDNILNPEYNMIGVGCAWSPFLNVFCWTQIFLKTDDADKSFIDLLPLYADDIKSMNLNPGIDIDSRIAKNMTYVTEAASKIAAGDKSAKQYLILGHASKFLGDYLGARDSFFNALKAEPGNVRIYSAIASTFDYPYDIQKRLAWLQKGESLGVRDSELYAYLAQTYSKLNQDEKALYYANLAVEVDPNSNFAISVRKNILDFQEYKKRNSH